MLKCVFQGGHKGKKYNIFCFRRDTVIVTSGSALINFVAGFIVFPSMGYIHRVMDRPYNTLVETGRVYLLKFRRGSRKY